MVCPYCRYSITHHRARNLGRVCWCTCSCPYVPNIKFRRLDDT